MIRMGDRSDGIYICGWDTILYLGGTLSWIGWGIIGSDGWMDDRSTNFSHAIERLIGRADDRTIERTDGTPPLDCGLARVATDGRIA